MVVGFESFRDAFKGYEDCYTIIGGAACDILMDKADLSFRTTKDIDMILLIDSRIEEFAKVFWDYIKVGGYRYGWKNSKQVHFYRFTDPTLPNYPVMIELFSRNPDYLLHNADSVIIPIHISDEVSSLSAIMLNDDYYNLMINGRKIVDGIGVLGVECLIPFKIRAWLDLKRRKENGEHVNSTDLKKHRNDVLRLFQLLDIDEKIEVIEIIKEDIIIFIELVSKENIIMKNIGLDFSVEEVLEGLRKVYL